MILDSNNTQSLKLALQQCPRFSYADNWIVVKAWYWVHGIYECTSNDTS